MVQSPPESAKAAEPITQPLRFWNVRLYGFDNIVTIAATRSKARWATFRGAREGGYYEGRDGFARFLADLGQITEISPIHARHQIGGHKPVGAPRDWKWEILPVG